MTDASTTGAVERAIQVIAGNEKPLVTLTKEEAEGLVAERAAAIRRAEAAEAECARITKNTTRFPDLMARIIAAKDQPLPDRIEALVDVMQKMDEYLHKYQWEADAKPLFGDKLISVGGDNGEGTGRQWIADTPSHLTGLAEYIAAANPDTVAMLIAELAEARRALLRAAPTERGLLVLDDRAVKVARTI